MRQVIALLKEASGLLREVEDETPIDPYTRTVVAKVFRAHASIKLAEAKLQMLMAEGEEPCKKP